MKVSPTKLAKIKTEYELIADALKQCDFHRGKAAKMLGIDPKTLYNKLRKHREATGKERIFN